MTSWKRPISVLVLIHTADLQILLLERALHPGYWQSVTGSQEDEESLPETAAREVREETGIAAALLRLKDWHEQHTYEIFPEWRHRYEPGVTHNTEHIFSLEVGNTEPITLSESEHSSYLWLPHEEAAQRCFSWTNRQAILALPQYLQND